jgi:hypothetical protein
LERIDDDVRHFHPTSQAECLSDRQSRASIGQPDFDYNVSTVGSEDVTQDVSVHGWQRHALEIPFKRSATFRTGSMQLRPDRAHPV